MTNVITDPLLISIAAPLAAALLLAFGPSPRWTNRLAIAGFAMPLLAALHVWANFSRRPAATDTPT